MRYSVFMVIPATVLPDNQGVALGESDAGSEMALHH